MRGLLSAGSAHWAATASASTVPVILSAVQHRGTRSCYGVEGPLPHLRLVEPGEASHDAAESTAIVGLGQACWKQSRKTYSYAFLRPTGPESSSHKAVTSWLCLSTSRAADFRAVCAQDDSMALGARKAFEQLPCSDARMVAGPRSWLRRLPNTGQAWDIGMASTFRDRHRLQSSDGLDSIELMAQFMERQIMPPVCTVTEPRSIPAIEELARRARAASASIRTGTRY